MAEVSPSATDSLGRAPIDHPIKQAISEAFKVVPPGKRGAMLVVSDESGTRMHLAAKLGDNWKVAGGGGVTWDLKPAGFVAVEASW